MTNHEHGWYKAIYAGEPTIAHLDEDGWWVKGYEHPMDSSVFDDIGDLVMYNDGLLATFSHG